MLKEIEIEIYLLSVVTCQIDKEYTITNETHNSKAVTL